MKKLLPVILALVVNACSACATITPYIDRVNSSIETTKSPASWEFPGDELAPKLGGILKFFTDRGITVEPQEGLAEEYQFLAMTSFDETGKISVVYEPKQSFNSLVHALNHEAGHVLQPVGIQRPIDEILAESIACAAEENAGIRTRDQCYAYLKRFSSSWRNGVASYYRKAIDKWAAVLAVYLR